MKRNVAAVFAGVALSAWSVLQTMRWHELQRRVDGTDFYVLPVLRHTHSKLLLWVGEQLGFYSSRPSCELGVDTDALNLPPSFGVFAVIAALVGATLAASMLRLNRGASIALLLVGLLMAVPGAAIAHDFAVEMHPSQISMPDFEMAPTQRCGVYELAPTIAVAPTETSCMGGVLGSDVETIDREWARQALEFRQEYEDLHRQAGDNDSNWRWERKSLAIIAEQNAPLPIIAAVIRGARDSGMTRGQIISRREQPGGLWTRPSVHWHACSLPVEFADDGVPVTQFASWRALVEAAENAPVPLKLRAE